MVDLAKERREILEFNAELRKHRRAFGLPDSSGHVAFMVPTLDYIAWCEKIPELGAADPQIARLAWMKFLNSEEGSKYKINPSEGKKARRTGIIVK
jgi:hypothetical protein